MAALAAEAGVTHLPKVTERDGGYTRSALDHLHFEDLELGGLWTTRGRTITESDLTAHAGLAGDFGALHMDEDTARAGHFGGRVAHGALLIGIALGLGSMDVPQPRAVALVGTNWRFLRPVRPGTTVRARWRLGRKRDVTRPQWGLVVWHIELVDARDERVLEGEVTVLVERRDIASPATASKRRRRSRGKGAAVTAEDAPAIAANPPEPAPAGVPKPASRRRTPASRPVVQHDTVETAVLPIPIPPEVAAAAGLAPAPASASSRRRRRRRGGSGNGGGSGATAGEPGVPQSAASPAQSGGEGAPAPAPSQQPTGWAAPEAAGATNPVSNLFGRLRRSRAKPAAPSPGGTRPPSE